ncbi:MAG: leucine-rich repeat protein [Lachnospiraceae bacterium]|nr:leucine-rich repeat protein [Lachnospiraceae bacterium]
MKKSIRKLLSLLLALCLLLSHAPLTAFAEEGGEAEQTMTVPAEEPGTEEAPAETDAEAAPREEKGTEAVPETDGTKADECFTRQPSGGTVAPGGSVKISWETSFVPVKVEVGIYLVPGDPSYFSARHTIETGLAQSMSDTLTYDEVDPDMLFNGGYWYVRAYYTVSTWTYYIDSNAIDFTRERRQFTEQPQGGTVNPEGSITISWKTNFVPVKVEVGERIELSGEPTYHVTHTITSGLSKSMSDTLRYDEIGTFLTGDWFVRAYYKDAESTYISSQYFDINCVDRKFTKQPQDITVVPDGTAAFSWTTNFTPVKVEIRYWWGTDSPTDALHETLTEGLSKSMSYSLPYDSVSSLATSWYVKAFYGDGTLSFAASKSFLINKTERRFTEKPQSGTVYPRGSFKISWTTNYIPVKIDIGYYNGLTWVSVRTLTDVLNKSMSYTMGYDALTTSDKWQVRAYYADYATNYVSSGNFSIEKKDVYDCGDDLTATLDDDGVLTLTGSGEMYDYSTLNPAPWYDSRIYVKKIVIPEGVTYIGEYAFNGCSALKDVTIPTSVKYIGEKAFYGCNSIDYVRYDGMKAQWFYIDIDGGNAGLDNAYFVYIYRYQQIGSTGVWWKLEGASNRLTISGAKAIHVTAPWQEWGDYITEIHVDYGDIIWEEAFRDCPNVKKVWLPGDIQKIDYDAFAVCTKITDVYFDGLQRDWEDITIESGNTPITNATLHTAPIYEMLTDDLSWTLDDEGLLTIFYDDGNMGSGEETDIPDYKNIGEAPWYEYKDNIKSVRIESGVTGIGAYAFNGCSNLRTLEIADTVTIIGNFAFSGCNWLEDFTFPSDLFSIGAYAFQACNMLEILRLPDSIVSLGTGVFYNCGNLEKIWLPGEITEIPINFCTNCYLLDLVSIPVSVKTVKKNAFYGCDSLTDNSSYVYYGGTSAQWAAITVDSGNECLTNAGRIHFITEELRIDAVNFPDANFRGYVSLNFDTDHSGWLNEEEIANAVIIYCGAQDIETLKGIEFFTELTELECEDNLLEELDLSANTKLTHLDCSYNSLTALSLDDVPNISYLDCTGNQLTWLDVSGLSLRKLYCSSNPLGGLNLGSQPELTLLHCYGTAGADGETKPLKVLDVRRSQYLLDAYMNGECSVPDWGYHYEGPLGGVLFVDVGTEVLTPDCISIDVTHFPDYWFREYIAEYIDKNLTQWLTPEEIAEAKEINTMYNEDYEQIESFEGIEYFTELEKFSVPRCPGLTSIDFSKNTKLYHIWLSNTGITVLDVSQLTLHEMLCEWNPLQTLTLGDQPMLWYLFCAGNDLDELDISGCPLLLKAYHFGSKLEGTNTGGFEYVEYRIIKDDSMTNFLCVNTDTALIGTDNYFQCGDSVTWSFEDGVLTISGTGDMWSFWETYPGFYELRDVITSIVVESGVTDIGAFAFFELSEVTQVTLPEGLTKLDTGAFNYCCSLTSITIPASMTEIGYSAFEECTGLTEIRFLGSAPSFRMAAFRRVVAEAYYPVDDPTWTDDVRQDYGGSITWISYLPLTFKHNCEFASNIALHYIVPQAELSGFDSFKLVVEMEKYEVGATEPTLKEYTITKWSEYTLGGEPYYQFIFPGIFAAEMGNQIYATVVAEKGSTEYRSAVDVYSVKDYAYNRLGRTASSTYRTFLVDMLNYGAAAQTHFNKNAANPVNAELTAEQQAYGTQEAPVLADHEDPVPNPGATAEINGKNLVFDSSVFLRYRMAFAEGQDMSKVKIIFTYVNRKGETKTQTVKASKFKTSGSYYTADCTIIIPSEMRCVVSATIYDGSTPISNTLNYSIETYVYNRLMSSTSATYKALILAMIKYGISAENHFS